MEKSAHKEFEKRIKDLEKINSVFKEISEAALFYEKLDELLPAIHKALGNIIDTTNFYLALYDKDTNKITFPYFIDKKDTPPPEINGDNLDSLTARVIKSKNPLLFRPDKNKSNKKKEKLLAAEAEVWLGVPLIMKDEVIGAIAVQSYTDPFLYSEKDIKLIETVSFQIANAISRIRVLDALKISEERFRKMAAVAPVVFWLATPDLKKTIYVSDAFEKIYGINREIIYSNPDFWFDVIHPSDKEYNVSCLKKNRLKGGEYEYKIISAERTIRWIKDLTSPIYDEKGKIILLSGIIEDITDRKIAEEERYLRILNFEKTEKIDRIIRQSQDIELMTNDVLESALSFFKCDRAFLLYPCDPNAHFVNIPMEKTVPEYPGTSEQNTKIAMTEEMAQIFNIALNSNKPVVFDPVSSIPVPNSARRFGILSQIFTVIYPKRGAPWAFVLQQCSRPRIWSENDQIIFTEISRRLTDALSSLISASELKEEKERFYIAASIASDLIYEWNTETDELFWYGNIDAALGYDSGEFPRTIMAWLSSIHKNDRKKLKEAVEFHRKSTEPINIEYRIKRKDGKWLNWVDRGKALIEHGKFKKVIGICTDITERKKAEEELQREKDLILNITQTSPVGIVMINKKGKITFANDRAEEVLGLKKDKITQLSYNSPEWVITDFEGNFYPDEKLPFAQVMKTRRPVFDVRHAIRWSNGKKVLLSINATPFFDAKGSLDGIVSTVENITQRIETEKAITESEAKFRNVIEATPLGVHLYKLDGKDRLVFKGANPAADKILGEDNSQFIGKTIEEAFPLLKNTQTPRRYKEIAKKGGSWKTEQIQYEDNKIKTAFEIYAFQTSRGQMAAKFMDTTERIKAEEEKKKLEGQLFQAQKMESIGRLAGGIAHDFNNILTSVMGYAEVLKMRLNDMSTPEGKAADVILSGTERAAELTKQLLGFARRGKFNPVPINVNTVLKETIKVSEKIFEKKINIHFDLEKQIHFVEADKNQLEQVFTNLLINAKDAMPGGGELYLITENVRLNDEYTDKYPEVNPGNYIKISVTDTGMGMTKKIMDHIFEPFYTTKGEGEGTGLGLATVYGIVKNHSGHITVYSEPGEGTTFNVYFPISEKSAEYIPRHKNVIPGSETILIVDDEKDVRESAISLLESIGYKVLGASNGKEAVTIYKRNKNEIGIVLLDMIMPKMAGKETFEKLIKINPEIKVLISSGYSQNGKANEIINKGALGFIQKPFRLSELSKVISKTLNR